MRRCDVINKIVSRTGITTADVKEVVVAFVAVVKNEVAKGNRIDIREFGSFQPKRHAAKKCRDIGRGTPMVIPERLMPAFKPSKKFFKVDQK